MPSSFAADTNNKTSHTILVLGDSLSAAYGIPEEKGWVALLSEKLLQEKSPYNVVNASISGETTDGGIARLPALLLRTKPSIMILELGANDGLRGLPISHMQHNLNQMVMLAKKQNTKVIIVGMRLPPNFGLAYTSAFFAAFRDIAHSEKLGYVPFLFEKISLDRTYFSQDNLHPNEAAQPLILETMWHELHKFL